MPAMTYELCWPDGQRDTCYSPSRVIRDTFEEGAAYPLDEFQARIRRATQIASDRVRARHGFPCTRASSQLALIERRAAGFAGQPDASVRVLAFQE